MDTTKCISDPDWESYSKGKLGGEALQLLEHHARSCEICADIKEGIDQMKDPSLLAERVSAIKLELDKTIRHEQKTVIAWWKWAAAAAVVLSSAWLAWQWPRFSEQTEKPGIALINPADTPLPEKKDKTMLKQEETIQAEQTKPNKAKVSRKIVIVADENIVENTNTEKLSSPASTDAAESEQKVIMAEEIQKDKKITAPVLDKVIAPTEQKEQVADTKVSSKTLQHKKEIAILPSNQLNNNQLSNNYTPQLDTFVFQNATEQFERKAYDSCLLSLNPILQFSASPLYEDALLMEAKVHLARAEKRKALQLLKKIVSMDGRLKKQAQEIINKN